MTLDALAPTADRWLAAATAATVRGGAALLLAWGFAALPRVPPAARCWAWRAAYAVLLAPLFWTTPVDVPLFRPPAVPVQAVVTITPPETVALPVAVIATIVEPATSRKAPVIAVAPHRPVWPSLLLLASVGYAAGYVAWLALGWRTAARLRRTGNPADPPDLRPLCDALNLRHLPAVRTGAAVTGPLLVGLFRPVILLPADLPPAAVPAVLAHELAHLRRRDLWWAWLPTLAALLVPWHPLVWPCNRRWRLAAEAACDADAIAATASAPADYARTLLAVATARRGPAPLALAVAAAEGRWALKRRLIAMTTITRWSRRRRVGFAVALTTLIVAVAVPWRPVARLDPVTRRPVALIGTTRPVSVLLVQADANDPLLEKAFAAQAFQDGKIISATRWERERPADCGMVIFDRYTPTYLPATGAYLWFGCAPPSRGWTYAERSDLADRATADVWVTSWRPDDRIIGRVPHLSTLHVARACSLSVPPDSSVLVDGSKGPLIATTRSGGRTDLVVGFDPSLSNWPLQVGFPLFVHAAVESLDPEAYPAARAATTIPDTAIAGLPGVPVGEGNGTILARLVVTLQPSATVFGDCQALRYPS